MKLSRRELKLLLPMLVASSVKAQTQPLPSRVYRHKQIAYTGDEKKKGREFFHGPNHSGFAVQMHETILSTGTQTHDPHKHEHEEIVIIVEGTAEIYLDGKTEPAEAGSVVYFASNQMHSARNSGATPCRYYVVELRGREA